MHLSSRRWNPDSLFIAARCKMVILTAAARWPGARSGRSRGWWRDLWQRGRESARMGGRDGERDRAMHELQRLDSSYITFQIISILFTRVRLLVCCHRFARARAWVRACVHKLVCVSWKKNEKTQQKKRWLTQDECWIATNTEWTSADVAQTKLLHVSLFKGWHWWLSLFWLNRW